jgi:hypothetical protein
MLRIFEGILGRGEDDWLDALARTGSPLPRDNREFVVALAREHNCRRVAEVGVWKGHLSRMFLAEAPLEHLLLVDPWKYECNLFASSSRGPHPTMMEAGVYNCRMGEATLSQEELDKVYQELVAEFQAAFPGKTCFLRMPSVEPAQYVANASLDLVFIDAIHLYENVLADIAAWLPKIKSNGILAGDDYSPAFQGVIDAVNETFPETIRHVRTATGVWYAYKKDLKRRNWLGRDCLARADVRHRPTLPRRTRADGRCLRPALLS